MSKELTKKQEKFCQKYIELGNASEAYREAYDAEKMKSDTVNVKASELLRSGKVSVRVKALQDEHKKRHDFTVDKALKEYEQARVLAYEVENPAAMVSATSGKVKLFGLGVENVNHNINMVEVDKDDLNL